MSKQNLRDCIKVFYLADGACDEPLIEGVDGVRLLSMTSLNENSTADKGRLNNNKTGTYCDEARARNVM